MARRSALMAPRRSELLHFVITFASTDIFRISPTHESKSFNLGLCRYCLIDPTPSEIASRQSLRLETTFSPVIARQIHLIHYTNPCRPFTQIINLGASKDVFDQCHLLRMILCAKRICCLTFILDVSAVACRRIFESMVCIERLD